MKHLALFVLLLLSSGSVFAQDFISYSRFGAVGDGKTDDMAAIVKAHEAANQAGLPVKADPDATYYIGPTELVAKIQTDTDWGNARFVIDDSQVQPRNKHLFFVESRQKQVRPENIQSLKKNQEKLEWPLAKKAFVVATDKSVMRYIRFGLNQNSGSPQTDVFIVHPDGTIDPSTPILWDFDQFSSLVAYPMDDEPLTVQGGRFTTIANRAESKYTYYSRGISVTRSNTVLRNIQHNVEQEQDHGAPYAGFLSISTCADVLVQDCILTGHKTYGTIGSAGSRVMMGSYDLSVNRTSHVTFKDCKQCDDIHDRTRWGIFGSNYSKNIAFDHVEFSRFDAHMGVCNATIKNSVLGHQGINIIGSGIFLLENTRVHGFHMIHLRSDYGSTFDGEFIIRNCEFIPRNGAKGDTFLITGSYSGKHNFGYPCTMPKKITIDGLVIRDSNPTDKYNGPKIFGSFGYGPDPNGTMPEFQYGITEELVLKNLTILSQKPWVLSPQPELFRQTRIVTQSQEAEKEK